MKENVPKKALLFIFITMLIDVVGLGIILPVLPELIRQIHGGDISDASRIGGWLTFAYAGMQFLFSPVVGGLSDRFGRRPVLLASLIAFGLDYILMGFAPTIGWLFIGRLVAGITGASFTTAGAYIADVSTPEKRAQNYGLLGAAFGVGFIIGPVIGGLLGHYGPRVPFFAAAAFALINAVYGYFLLPESLRPENRRPFDWKRANPVGSLRHLTKYPIVLKLVVAFVFIFVAGHANQSTWTYYTIEKFKWSSAEVGYSLGFVGLMVAIVQGGLIRIVIPKIGQKRAVYFGLFFYSITFAMFAVATQGWMMYAIMIPSALGGFAVPAIQGIMTSQVPSNEQGELQGALTSLISLTSIFGPLLMTGLFSFFSKAGAPVYFPGAPFMMAAVLSAVSMLFSVKTLGKRG